MNITILCAYSLVVQRLSGSLESERGQVMWAIGATLPMIYITLTLLRGLLIAAFTPLIRQLSGSDIDLSWQVRDM